MRQTYGFSHRAENEINSLLGLLFSPRIRSKVLRLVLLPRKEVIHPHLPVRIPCYDLTPIMPPTLGRLSGLRVLVTFMV